MMKSPDGRLETRRFYIDFVTGVPGISLVNVSPGVWDIRITDPRYTYEGIALSAAGGGSNEVIADEKSYITERPPRIRISFMTSGGVAGAYGGNACVYLRRKRV